MTMQPDKNNSIEANRRTLDHPRHRRMLEPLISLYQDDEVSPAERLTVERYLATCAECRQVLAAYNRVSTQLQGFLNQIPEPRPLPSFSKNGHNLIQDDLVEVLPRSGEIRAGRSARVPQPPRFTPVLAGRLGGMAAAIVLIVSLLGLVVIYRNSQSNPEPTQVVGAGQFSATPEQDATVTPSPEPNPSATPTNGQPTLEPSPTQAPPNPTTVPPVPQTTQAVVNPPANTTKAQGGGIAPTNTSKPASPVTTVAPKTNPPSATNTAIPATTAATTPPALVATDSPVPATTTVAPTTVATTTEAPTATTPPAAATTEPPAATTPPPAIPAPVTEAPPVATTAAATAPVRTPITPAPAVTTPGPVTVNVPGWIAYVSTQDGEIHLVNSDGTSDVTLSKDSAANGIKWEELVWSHDANWVAAVAQNTGSGDYGIYVYDIGKRDAKLNFVAQGFAPAWSPNDLSMAFLAGPVKTKDGLKMGRPSVLNLKKREVQPPTTLSDEYQALVPQWFEEGTRLLIGQNQVVAPDGTPLNTFELPFDNSCAATSLSPFGNKLATMQPTGLVIYDLSKGTLDKNKPLARLPINPPGKIGYRCGSYRLRWTPSGRSVYFYVNNGGIDTTCVVSATGAGDSCLSGVYEPSFTVDGGDLVDFNPNAKGQFYAIPFGPKPASVRVLASSKVPPVWQPRWS